MLFLKTVVALCVFVYISGPRQSGSTYVSKTHSVTFQVYRPSFLCLPSRTRLCRRQEVPRLWCLRRTSLLPWAWRGMSGQKPCLCSLSSRSLSSGHASCNSCPNSLPGQHFIQLIMMQTALKFLIYLTLKTFLWWWIALEFYV